MAKKERIEGYSVVVFVPVREHQPEAAYRVGGAPDAPEAYNIASHIAEEIRKHVGPDYYAARDPEVDTHVMNECEHCGYPWHGTVEDPDYNGGCCAGDEDEHLTRLATTL